METTREQDQVINQLCEDRVLIRPRREGIVEVTAPSGAVWRIAPDGHTRKLATTDQDGARRLRDEC